MDDGWIREKLLILSRIDDETESLNSKIRHRQTKKKKDIIGKLKFVVEFCSRFAMLSTKS